MKIGIFGGTFNPVHYGHLRAAEEVRERLALDTVLIIPSRNPPLKTKDIAPAKHRYEMLKLALRGSKQLNLSDIEFGLKGKSYTVRTIETLQLQYRNAEFCFILGIDAFLDIPNWWHPERLTALTDFAIISRPGYLFEDLRESPYLRAGRGILKELDSGKTGHHRVELASKRDVLLLPIPPVGISSTEIRRLLWRGRSIKFLLPPEVESYIISNKLYKN
ncbi:MAG: nicotinate-nucleotide adenylyltransferase [Thermodesulfovibrionales bacterium]|nr:nicotinate-nucleotide adenylyltransferase [Thermodesulfovibrionales bacterium]